LADDEIKYLELKNLFENNLPEDVPIYQEYHALIVEHAKRYYSKKPYGVADPLTR
ncbi:MAG TPA: endonuclease III domain-containing protein, partial [Methanobacterium sp.]|nr:endonuclease III domain-containing protein [Methanobacterium sp.]